MTVLFGEVVESSAPLKEVFQKHSQLLTVAENLLVIMVVILCANKESWAHCELPWVIEMCPSTAQ